MQDTNQIREWVYSKRKNIIRDIGRIVNICSVSDIEELQEMQSPFGEGCRFVLDEMLAIGKDLGFQTENYNYYCGRIYYEKRKSIENSITIWGHLDVVPAGDDWEYEPYEMTVEGDYLIGRGVQDNKGPTIGALYALLYLKEAGIPMNTPVSLMVGCSEETGMQDIDYYIKNYKQPAFSIVADCGFPVCYGENGIINIELQTRLGNKDILAFHAGSTSNSIPETATIILKKSCITAQKKEHLKASKLLLIEEERNQIKLTAKGKSAHVCMVHDSKNAIGILVKELLRLDLLPEEEKALKGVELLSKDAYGIAANLWDRNYSLGQLTGGATMIRYENSVLTVSVDYRYPILTNGIISDGKELLDSLKVLSREAGFTCIVRKHLPPSYIPANKPLIQELTKVYQEVSGLANPPYTMGGTTYTRKLKNAIGYGMALPDKQILRRKQGHGDFHQPDESLHIGELMEGIVIYIKALLKLNDLEISDLLLN
ncbi:succinyl-diaminopimelate desuccinylase [Anaerocolumna jejuensis DSM 15929]|uniref:Succinyl-diaminopimelate desuccinylase n=1 Tax=Anaerocolumna jejuensis DSM 15929 TaxID=1121322 RepID=A0A1M6MXX6_9FIRM|nr:Sapep family Mn(2+)-dependent dipeptidase [Anaerocolumna jejuensis]SHJ88262.1 succinyl-diaminopimelate desuccinylase [Anaerocolumna jejuensis DSM 15929]